MAGRKRIIEAANEMADRLKGEPSQYGLENRFCDFQRRKQELVDGGLRTCDADSAARKEYALYDRIEGERTRRDKVVAKYQISKVPEGVDFDLPRAVEWAANRILVEHVDTENSTPLGLLFLSIGKENPSAFAKEYLAPLLRNASMQDMLRGIGDDKRKQADMVSSLAGLLDGD